MRGHLRITEHVDPFGEPEVGGGDEVDMLLRFADEMDSNAPPAWLEGRYPSSSRVMISAATSRATSWPCLTRPSSWFIEFTADRPSVNRSEIERVGLVVAVGTTLIRYHEPQKADLLAQLRPALDAGGVEDILRLREQALADSAASELPDSCER